MRLAFAAAALTVLAITALAVGAVAICADRMLAWMDGIEPDLTGMGEE